MDARHALLPRRWTVVALHDPDGEADDLADFRVMIAGVFQGHHTDHADSVLAGGYERMVEHVIADSAEEAAEIATARIVGDEDDDDR